MLKNDFYTIAKFDRKDDMRSGFIHLNPSHAIFEGHFPNIPIVPGVVLMQIVKEIVEEEMGFQLILIEAKNVKFLDFINPKEITKLFFEIIIKSVESGLFKVQATIKSQKATHFKLSANYKPIKD